MNAPVLSRCLLLSASTAVLGTAVPAALPALAGPFEAMSPQAAALLREFHDIAGRFNAAGRRLDDAMETTARVPGPRRCSPGQTTSGCSAA